MTSSLTTPVLDNLLRDYLREHYPNTRDRYTTLVGTTEKIHYGLLTSDFIFAEHVLCLFETMGADPSGYLIYNLVANLSPIPVLSPHLRGLLGELFAVTPFLGMGSSTHYCCEHPPRERVEALTYNFLFKRKLALLLGN